MRGMAVTRRGSLTVVALLALAAGTALVTARAADPSALWHIVNDKCVPDAQQNRDPSPCASVDLSDGVGRGYAVLKDIVGATQFLLIPTARIAGMESPELLALNAPNYWDDAWRARHFVEERAQRALPREALSLAINSSVGRSQDQLHIHIDCVRADVRASLAAHEADIQSVWAPFPMPLAGHSYRAMRVESIDLGPANPFQLLADSGPDMPAEMGMHTLVVVGMTYAGGKPGFVLLDDRADLAAGDRASGEELQDHACAAAR
jgi:CDP-diacylglycerol pyrophosphatase